MSRHQQLVGKLCQALAAAASRRCSSALACGVSLLQESAVAKRAPQLQALWSGPQLSSLHTSCAPRQEVAEAAKPPVKLYEPERKYRPLADKELWHEAWMYEDRFGTEEDPVVVPSLEGERIIGVTDPEDDNLVVWGILRAGEPARQLIEGGEYYVLKKVPYVAKVGDVLELIESGAATATISK